MTNMFYYCSSLISLDLSYFNTSQVTNMVSMFEYCSSLISVDLSNFNTSQVTNMNNMFSYCSSLISLNLSNFNTSKINFMKNMFAYCSSLTSLDLSNFNTPQIIDMNSMFISCANLEYINLNNFDMNNLGLVGVNSMFSNVTKNIAICINENINMEKIFPQIIDCIKCYTVVCSNDWKSKQKKIINNTDECIDRCDNCTIYKYEYNGKCYDNCSNGFLYDNNSNIINKCKCELDKCLLCSPVALNNNLCTKCNINYYPKENDPLNLGDYINCYNESEEGNYLDNKFNLFRKCYNTCKTCDEEGNISVHNCKECNDNFLFRIKINNYFNCYENCIFYYYINNENNFICTWNSSCPKEYPLLLENIGECIK